MTEPRTDWHALDVSAAVAALEGDLAAGLSHDTAAERLASGGRNVLPEGEKTTILAEPYLISAQSRTHKSMRPDIRGNRFAFPETTFDQEK